MEERRAACREHRRQTDKLERVISGNGRKGLLERVARLEMLIWIVIMLLMGNGGLIAFTLFSIKN